MPRRRQRVTIKSEGKPVDISEPKVVGRRRGASSKAAKSADGVTKHDVFAGLLESAKAALGDNEEFQTKAMFGGLCFWVDGGPKVGVMLGGVTSKLDICLRCRAGGKLNKELSAAGATPMMGKHMPWLLLHHDKFNKDPRKLKWIQQAAEEGREYHAASNKSDSKKTAKKSKTPKKTTSKRARTAKKEPERPSPAKRARKSQSGTGPVKEESKVKPEAYGAEVEAYIEAQPESRQPDCRALLALMQEVTGLKAELNGTIVGFGTYHYKYASGREGDSVRTGFSSRKTSFSIYVMPGFDEFQGELAALGKHKTGKSCLYINKLADVDLGVLRAIVGKGVAMMNEKYPE